MADHDIFISYKNTDELGRPTRDASMAESLYHALRIKGHNPFFSKYSIDANGRSDYMTAINEALESARVLVAVGTSRQNLTSRWVKREINMFSALMMREEEGALTLLSYRSPDFPADELPASLADLQSHTDEKAVIRVIDACLNKASGFRNTGGETELLFDDRDVTTILSSSTPTDSPKPTLQTGSVIDGRYTILGLLGQGGMSSVYLAMNQPANHQCAVKEIRKDGVLDFQVVHQGLCAEIDLLKKINHPAIPKIYEVIDIGNSFMIVMEYVSGEPLYKLLSDQGPQRETLVLSIAQQLAHALDYLHNQPSPIIYRDMKPANIMLQPNGRVKLIDFGTARYYKRSSVEDTTCLGTIGYAAPEQFGGMGQTDARTDIYNLGATLYHLVTGKNPAMPPYEILPVREVNPDLSRGLEMIIQKCTQKDPNQRFQSAKELLDALENIHNLNNPPRVQPFFNPIRPLSGQDSSRSRPQPPIPAAQPVPAPKPLPREQSYHDLLNSIQVPDENFYSAPTEPLRKPALPQRIPQPPAPQPAASPAPPPVPPKKAKPKVRKVSARPKAPANSNAEMDAVIAKLAALDPVSQQIVCDLIERLSK